MTLDEAIKNQIIEFGNNNKTFSVHDITSELRRKTANGDIEIPEVQVDKYSFKFEISHAKVKNIFDYGWTSGEYNKYFTLNRNFNRVYYEYTATVINNPSNSNDTTSSNVNSNNSAVATNSPTNNSNIISNIKSNNQFNVDDIIKNNIKNYIIKHNNSPTIKEIQSAIKRKNYLVWTCEQIKAYVEQTLNYKTSGNSNHYSKYVVLT